MPFPRAAIVQRLNQNVDDLLGELGNAARALFLAEIYSPGDDGEAAPFLKILIPQLKLAATIERSLTTRLGRGWDHMAADIARAAYGNALTNHHVVGQIPAATSNQIQGIVDAYHAGQGHAVPNTPAELAAILPGVHMPGAKEAVDEKDDVFFVDIEGVENHVEIKTTKPNYDQAKASKRRILRINAVRHPTAARAIVGMVYNPNGLRGQYEWPITKYFLDIKHDLKLGQDFWNYLGHSETTYEELLDCFYEVSSKRQPEILALMNEV